MSEPSDIMAAVVKDKPHSFQFIRRATGLTMSDDEFAALVRSDARRFRLVKLLRRDDKGSLIRPGRPGVALRTANKA